MVSEELLQKFPWLHGLAVTSKITYRTYVNNWGEVKCLLNLDLSNNPFSCSSLPVVSKLQSLRQLRLYKTNLCEIPVQICGYLHHVKVLGLSDNNLKCLPKEIVNLTKLKEIYLQKNRFESFPKELCQLLIDLEQNLISLIPEEGGFLTNLVRLFLAFNNLSSIPPTLQHCQKLAVLDLSHNLLHNFPHICCWPSLSHVFLRNVGVHTRPGSFTRLTSVRILHLSENCFGDIPKGICTMKNLEALALDDNQIQEIPAEVKELATLKCLSLSENRFSIFPKEIFLLESLERLYSGKNKGIKFRSLPEDITKLQNLKELHMENNCLEYPPPAISSLTLLKILDRRNNLPDSPFAFVCSGLQKLLIQKNHLSQLPENLDNLQQLELVLVDENSMTDPLTEMC
ncbi:LOW QUALITY PROTEIN: leucine-rich repeat and IQ domain-containing protein 4 [Cariama cristata]